MVYMHLLRPICLTLLLGVICTAQVRSDNPRGRARAAEARAAGMVDVIVQYDGALSEEQRRGIRARGGSSIRELQAADAVAVRVPVDELDRLLQEPNVARISRDSEVSAAMTSVDAATGANVAHDYGWSGAGIGIALIDSGIDRHADLPTRVLYTKDYVDPQGSGTDGHGHGTHIAGIIVGKGQNRDALSGGIAPGAHLINLRVLDENGYGRESDVIEAIGEAIALKDLYNIRVINLSLGRPVLDSWTNDPLCAAVKRAWDAGIVVVVAAGNYGRLNDVGNNGYGTITSPGNAPSVITVGAMNTKATPERSDDVMTTYSSKGPAILDYVLKPDLAAPGNRILSTIGDSQLAEESPEFVQAGVPARSRARVAREGVFGLQNDYMQLSGTSMAAPVVAGAVALMLQQDPSLSPDTVKVRLMKTATTDFPEITDVYDPDTDESFVIQNDIFTIGAGYIDIAAALLDTTVVSGRETA